MKEYNLNFNQKGTLLYTHIKVGGKVQNIPTMEKLFFKNTELLHTNIWEVKKKKKWKRSMDQTKNFQIYCNSN